MASVMGRAKFFTQLVSSRRGGGDRGATFSEQP